MILIAALADNRVIGSGDGMPWSIPEEYAQYLDFVRDQTVIMGRRSWEIFGDDLTAKHALVVSRSSPPLEGAEVCGSLERAIERGRELGGTLFCAGGAGIYAQAMPLASQMYLSFIKGDFEGDAYFPEIDDSAWEIERELDHSAFRFVAYRRRDRA